MYYKELRTNESVDGGDKSNKDARRKQKLWFLFTILQGITFGCSYISIVYIILLNLYYYFIILLLPIIIINCPLTILCVQTYSDIIDSNISIFFSVKITVWYRFVIFSYFKMLMLYKLCK